MPSEQSSAETMQAVADVDPNADRCPWCGGVRIWKGHHASAQHPEKWAAFKNYYTKETSASVTWEEPDAN